MSETKQCQNCKNEFRIEPEDFLFYEKIKVPAPTWCPECRLKRRLISRQDRTLYRDNCDLCGKDMMSMYHPDSPYTVYCSPCWWSDKWDALEYGREYDFKKPFFEQFGELMRSVPRQATFLNKSVDCEYCDATTSSKNCYLNFGSYYSEDCLYCNGPIFSRSSVDADFGMNMDHAYETYASDDIYNTKFGWFSVQCFDSDFLFDCKGCSHCFGCINLRNKKYHIFNEPYSKKEYEEKIGYWDLGSYERLQEAKQKFKSFYYSMPHRWAAIINSTNVTGNGLVNTKNCHQCFSTINGVENCKFAFLIGLNAKDSYDVSFSGETLELLYETSGLLRSSRTFFTKGGTEILNSEYCDLSRNSRYLFGCAGVRDKSYCILNKQYSEIEYRDLADQIKEQMNTLPYVDARGNVYRYGEYFPDELSVWAYNESYCFEWFPLTKEDALKKGYRWQDREERNYQITVAADELSDHIQDVPDSIVNQIIECAHKGECNHECVTAYRIIPRELAFYRAMNIALPRLCYNCRFYERIYWRTPPKLWNRACQCAGTKDDRNIYTNSTSHFHGGGHCPNTFDTAFNPERKEIVYCKDCYQDEFV